jgi:hypothetical protein
MFLLDGSTILLAHSPELAKAYSPPRNQHGASHWPVPRSQEPERSSLVALRTSACATSQRIGYFLTGP